MSLTLNKDKVKFSRLYKSGLSERKQLCSEVRSLKKVVENAKELAEKFKADCLQLCKAKERLTISLAKQRRCLCSASPSWRRLGSLLPPRIR